MLENLTARLNPNASCLPEPLRVADPRSGARRFSATASQRAHVADEAAADGLAIGRVVELDRIVIVGEDGAVAGVGLDDILDGEADLFTAGVDLHGVHDWNVVIRNFAPTYDATAREDVARLAFQSSPMASISTWRSPVLLIHGDDDRNVPFSETVDIVEALRGQGVQFEQLIFPDEVHDFLLHRHWLQAYTAAADFFDRKLKGGAAAASR